jgi:hypothetical protein
VQKLRAGKLREAEALLESALAAQSEGLQPPALYNLGHVRFGQGFEELKKGPSGGPATSRGRAAAQLADSAIRQADQALGGNNVQEMVAAYLRGRGARRELKPALAAVRKALQTHGAALGKWQRSSGDFHGAVELNRADADGRQNAEVVDRYIARLIDMLRELDQLANMLCDKNSDLGQKLKQLKGRIPAPDAPPGGAGDDDEEEDKPFGPQPGDQEGATKEGLQMLLSREMAGWLLDGYRLDSERRLPMGQNEASEPRQRKGKDW